jgi:hypothetical protein
VRRLLCIAAALGLAALACRKDASPPPSSQPAVTADAAPIVLEEMDAGIYAPLVGATAPSDAGSARPSAPAIPSFESLCGATLDAGLPPEPAPAPTPSSTSAAPGGPVIDVTFSTTHTPWAFQPKIREVRGRVRAPKLELDQSVLGVTEDGVHQCCSRVVGGELHFDCFYSEAVSIQGQGYARREGYDLVVRWCSAIPLRRLVRDQGIRRFELPEGATLRFHASVPACDPKGL